MMFSGNWRQQYTPLVKVYCLSLGFARFIFASVSKVIVLAILITLPARVTINFGYYKP